MTTCPDCKGSGVYTGFAYERFKCPTCDGTGDAPGEPEEVPEDETPTAPIDPAAELRRISKLLPEQRYNSASTARSGKTYSTDYWLMGAAVVPDGHYPARHFLGFRWAQDGFEMTVLRGEVVVTLGAIDMLMDRAHINGSIPVSMWEDIGWCYDSARETLTAPASEVYRPPSWEP